MKGFLEDLSFFTIKIFNDSPTIQDLQYDIAALSRKHYKNATMYSVCVIFELRVTFNHIEILSVEQQCFHDEFMSSATIKLTKVSTKSVQSRTETK